VLQLIGKLFGWLGRKVVLYAILLVAIAASSFVVPRIKQIAVGKAPAQIRTHVLDAAASRIALERNAAAQSFKEQARNLRSQSIDKLDQERRSLITERAQLLATIGTAKSAWILAIVDQGALLTVERSKLRVAVIDQQLSAISAAREAALTNGASVAAKANLAVQQREVERLIPLCNQASRNLGSYEQRWRWKLRRWWESDEHKALVVARNQRCAVARASISRRDDLVRITRQTNALNRHAQEALAGAAGATAVIQKVGVDLAKDAERARIEFSGSLPERLRTWSERWKLTELLRTAGIALAVIIAIPFLIRLLCYFVLAPLAMRSTAVRIRIPGGRSVSIPPSAPSATSVGVRLAQDEELLVRQDYLQTSSHAGRKGTQWWLDWTKPITSIATGLTFLTRIRGDGEVTTVSAVRDGLAEVTIMTLPEGAACVLQPRALAAVAQPIGRRLRITRHWRLGSLNAWLTLQLRYLVFHGPVRLVLKGGRGVRVEAAEQGRVFGQDQLVGFSADLAYAVTRTETFWPYFLGREQLLKDRVMAGEGVLIVEEAPLTARRGEVRRGLEGMIDAGMKVFGM
jgi:hypothetical protein